MEETSLAPHTLFAPCASHGLLVTLAGYTGDGFQSNDAYCLLLSCCIVRPEFRGQTTLRSAFSILLALAPERRLYLHARPGLLQGHSALILVHLVSI